MESFVINHLFTWGAKMGLEKNTRKISKKIVVLPEGFMRELPEEVKKKVLKELDKLKDGLAVGEKMDMAEPNTFLICGECESKDMSWLLDKSSEEVYYRCYGCGNKGWMTENEYENSIKKYPECIYWRAE